MKEKADIIKMGVDSGLTHLNDIRDTYNSFAEGGYKKWRDALLEWGPYLEEDVMSENPSYDYRGFYYDNPDAAWDMLREDSGTHFTDKFKYPSHPTFSNESIYSFGDHVGGRWEELDDGRAFYIPSEYTNNPERMATLRKYLNNTGEGYAVGNEVHFPSDGLNPKVGYTFDDIVVTPKAWGGRINRFDEGGGMDDWNSYYGGYEPEGMYSYYVSDAYPPIYVDRETEDLYYVNWKDGRMRMQRLSSLDEGYEIYNKAKEREKKEREERLAKKREERQKELDKHEAAERKKQEDRERRERERQELEDKMARDTEIRRQKSQAKEERRRKREEKRGAEINRGVALVQGAMDQSAYVDKQLPSKVMTAYNNQEAAKHEKSESEKMTTRLMNTMSFPQLVRGVYDAATGEKSFAESMEGNNGIVPDVVAQDDPDRAFMTNLMGDIGAYYVAEQLYNRTLGNYFQRKDLANTINTSIERAEFPEPVETYDPMHQRIKVGDVEINNPNITYRQGREGMVQDFLNEGKVVAKSAGPNKKPGRILLTKKFDTPMFREGRLWYDGALEEFPWEVPSRSDLLTTAETLQMANKYGRPGNGSMGRRIPFSEDQLGFRNTTPYVYEEGYGFRKVPIYPEREWSLPAEPSTPTTMPEGNTNIKGGVQPETKVPAVYDRESTVPAASGNKADTLNKPNQMGINNIAESYKLDESTTGNVAVTNADVYRAIKPANTFEINDAIPRKQAALADELNDIGNMYGEYGDKVKSSISNTERNLDMTTLNDNVDIYVDKSLDAKAAASTYDPNDMRIRINPEHIPDIEDLDATMTHDRTHTWDTNLSRKLSPTRMEMRKDMMSPATAADPSAIRYTPREVDALNNAYFLDGMGIAKEMTEKGAMNRELRRYISEDYNKIHGRYPTVQELNDYIDRSWDYNSFRYSGKNSDPYFNNTFKIIDQRIKDGVLTEEQAAQNFRDALKYVGVGAGVITGGAAVMGSGENIQQ